MVFLMLGVAATPAMACNYTYTVIDPTGRETVVSEGNSLTLVQGETYVLRMEYWENHRNCTVTPEDTLYLVDGARWRPDRDTQPLILRETAEWEQTASRTHRGEFTFDAAREGAWSVEVVRVCDRGGYHGAFLLEVR